jgi:hypothetical protein
LTSGSPFTPTMFDISGLGTGGQRPSLAPGKSLDDAVKGGITQYFDPSVFVSPQIGTLGNVGRNSLRGPGYANVDMSFSKNVLLTGSHSIQLRAEVFNLFNRANFGQPNGTVFVPTPGGAAAVNPAAGRITTALDPRRMQFAVKYLF